MNNVRVGIIGIGNMGSAHANCILNNGINGMTLTAVCDIDVFKIKSFKNAHLQIPVFTDFKELLNSGLCDSVIIAVPHKMHADIAIEALSKGLHTLVEKPVDITVSKAKILNEVAEKSGKVFGIMFNQRTNPLFQKAREIVKSGSLGELKRTVWIITNWYRTQKYYDSGDWRGTWSGEGGGVLINQAPHQLDIWQWICGMPKSVTAFCDVNKYHNINVEDDVTILARYGNGAIGTFISSTGEFPGTNRLEISGTLGKLVLENGMLKWWKLMTNEREVCQNSNIGYAEIPIEYKEFSPSDKESAHKGILQNFTNAILFGETLLADGKEGINELTISNAAYLSDWKNNIEISLPIDENEFDKILFEKMSGKYDKKKNNSSEITGTYIKRWNVNW